MKKDIGVLGKGKSDPYAIVTVGAQQFRTQTIDSTVNPKWDYWCEVMILVFIISLYCLWWLFLSLFWLCFFSVEIEILTKLKRQVEWSVWNNFISLIFIFVPWTCFVFDLSIFLFSSLSWAIRFQTNKNLYFFFPHPVVLLM